MNRTATVECPGCGRLREIHVGKASHYWTALNRLCWPCAVLEANNDVDPMAVERLITGSRVNATPGERREAVAYLTRSGRSARVIADRIGCSKRTVERHRARLATH